jgi:hypothetical protein
MKFKIVDEAQINSIENFLISKIDGQGVNTSSRLRCLEMWIWITKGLCKNFSVFNR